MIRDKNQMSVFHTTRRFCLWVEEKQAEADVWHHEYLAKECRGHYICRDADKVQRHYHFEIVNLWFNELNFVLDLAYRNYKEEPLHLDFSENGVNLLLHNGKRNYQTAVDDCLKEAGTWQKTLTDSEMVYALISSLLKSIEQNDLFRDMFIYEAKKVLKEAREVIAEDIKDCFLYDVTKQG